MIRSTLIALTTLVLVSPAVLAGEVGNSFKNGVRVETGEGQVSSYSRYEEKGEKYEVSLQRDAGMNNLGTSGAGAYTRSDTQSTFKLQQGMDGFEKYKYVGSETYSSRTTFAN